MGSKGPLIIVTPAEWLKRTSLTFSKRSPSTRRVDAAYADWFSNPKSPQKAGVLRDALDDYLKEKGNDWSRVDRDKESGGLMQYIYELVVESSGGRVIPKGMAALQSHDIPHSRYGVLYLLGNIDIDMNYLKVGLEGVGAIGGAVGSGLATDLHHLNSRKLSTKTVDIGSLKHVSEKVLASGGKKVFDTGVKLWVKPASSTGTHAPRPTDIHLPPEPPQFSATNATGTHAPQPPYIQRGTRPTPGFPVTLALFDLVKEDPALMLNPFVLPATLVIGAGAAVIEGLNSLRILIQNAISDLFEWVKNKMLGDGRGPGMSAAP
jgi:hypothetical protein